MPALMAVLAIDDSSSLSMYQSYANGEKVIPEEKGPGLPAGARQR